MMKVHPMYHCDKWGGAESRGSGYERHLCHSQVSSPTEELQKDKRSDNSARRERTRPGLFMLCFCLCFMWQTHRPRSTPTALSPAPLITTTYYTQLYFSANDNFSVFLTQHCVTDLEVLKYSSKVVGTFLVAVLSSWTLDSYLFIVYFSNGQSNLDILLNNSFCVPLKERIIQVGNDMRVSK